MRISLVHSLVISVLAVAFVACGDRPAAEPPTTSADSYGEQLGEINFPVSCSHAALPHIERGIALLHHMTYVGAENSFSNAVHADPECAMGYWGLAMSYVHPLWPDVPPEAELVGGLELLETAEAIAEKTDREEAYIAAAKAYYVDATNRSEAERLASLEAGWKRVHEDYSEDLEASAFYALALMATAMLIDPDSRIRASAGEIAEEVLAQAPDHPGAHHYIIHAYDTTSFAQRALEIARNYGKLAPDVPHALHMPTHIFTRLGLWPESIEWNLRSADAAQKGLNAKIISKEYLHALDYLSYAYLQTGADEKAAQLREKTLGMQGPYGARSRTISAYALAAIPARYPLERREWADAAALQARVPDSFPWRAEYSQFEALTWFANGIGAARSGNPDAAGESVRQLEILLDHLRETGNDYWARRVEIQRLSVEAWLALAKDDPERAGEVMEQAADLEARTDKHAVTPGELLPARELLGDLYLELDEPAAALTAYEAVLAESPNRFNSLYGAAVSAEAMGDEGRAAEHYRALVEMCRDARTDRPRLANARAFLEGHSGSDL